MIYKFDDYVLNQRTAELSRDGVVVPVEPLTYKILTHLVENRDRMVTRDELIETIWSGRIVSEWAVSAAIKAARSAIGDTSAEKHLIRTVRGSGFRFVGDVSEPTGEAGHDDPRLAILPFTVVGEHAADSYLADGIAEDLLTVLAGQPGIVVPSRNGCFLFKGATPTPAEVAEVLGVGFVLEGTLQRNGNLLRITVRLADTDSGAQIWAERFDQPDGDLLTLQDDIVAQIHATLQVRGPLPKRAAPTANPAAHDLFLQGRAEYHGYTPPHLARAEGYFRQATDLDPTFAEALAYRSYCRCTCHVFGLPGSDETLEPALDLARRAVALAPNSGSAQARLGWILGFTGPEKAARAAFERARTAAPRSAEVLQAYGETCNRLARPQAALPLIDAAARLDPFAPPSWRFARGHSLILSGRSKDAREILNRVIGALPGFLPARVQMTRALVDTGDLAAARAMADAILANSPRYTRQSAARMFPYPDAEQARKLDRALTDAGLPG